MKIIVRPEDEEKILLPAKSGATPAEVYESTISKAEACVVHLCGCRGADGGAQR